MKRWAIITVGLYGLLLLALTVPGIFLFRIVRHGPQGNWVFEGSLGDALDMFSEWGYWLTFAIFIAAQALLLLIPVARSAGRPIARRTLLAPVVVTSLLVANLFLAGLFSLAGAIFADDAGLAIEVPGDLLRASFEAVPPAVAALRSFGWAGSSDLFYYLTAIGMLIALWMAWALIFYHHAQGDEPDTLVRRATRWLLRGSILELLVAVPSHIIVRHRGDCCAPIATFWGIVSGLAVMLLAFGPGVYFLFVRRIRDRRAAPPKPADRVDAPDPGR